MPKIHIFWMTYLILTKIAKLTKLAKILSNGIRAAFARVAHYSSEFSKANVIFRQKLLLANMASLAINTSGHGKYGQYSAKLLGECW
jgi:hypothetical protein